MLRLRPCGTAGCWRLLVVAGALVGLATAQTSAEGSSEWAFPCSEEGIERYTSFRIDETITVDGRLDERVWGEAPRSPRFEDLISAGRAIHDTRAAVLWDAQNLYIGFWVEEPDVRGDLTERDSPIYKNNDVEVFIAGRDAYYEFEINSLGTIYEVLFVWDEAYEAGEYRDLPELAKDHPQARSFNGVGLRDHPRGMRTGFWGYDLPGLQTAVQVDGTLNDDQDRDRGWTVELSFPWASLQYLAGEDGRALPPEEGDEWRIDFTRFNQYKEAPPAVDSGGWAWSTHGVWDSHVPECFPFIRFTSQRLESE
jgi:hypothetical protein